MEILKNLEKYIDNLKQIRALSSPSLNGIFDETGYSRQLSENFVRIGHLAEENRDILVTHKSPVKGVIDLVQCADGLDAASDSVGRSYNRGKTYDEYIEEVREGSGSRYAPWLYELLSRPEVKKDIESILSEGREKHYRYTYRLLKSVQDNENQ